MPKKKTVSFKTKSGKKISFKTGSKKRKRKRTISIKAIKASIASPKTPIQLKKGLRKLLAKRMKKK